MKGRVSSYNNRKGFGFITPDDGTKDVFVHQSAIKIGTTRSLAVGQSVEFEVKVGNDGRNMAAYVTKPNCRGSGGRGRGRGCGHSGGGRGGGGEEEAFSEGIDVKPPPDIEILIRNCAASEGAFGREFAKLLFVQVEKGNSRVNFLLPGDKYHAYYEQCVSEVRTKIQDDLSKEGGSSSSMPAILRKMNILHNHQVDSKAANVRMRK